jgi:hypothetical protein
VRRRLCSVTHSTSQLKDSIIIVRMHVVRPSTVKRRTLLEFVSAQSQAGATYAAAEMGTGVGTMAHSTAVEGIDWGHS